MNDESLVSPFERALRAEGGVDLARAFAAVGLIAEPELDLDAVVAHLGSLGSEVREEAAGAPTASTRLSALVEALFVRRGFRGDEQDYDDPRNRYLHEALQRYLGIPITLSIIVMEVGGALGLQIEGVGFPAHFLVRATTEHGPVYLDPFNRGRVLPRTVLAEMLRRQGGEPERQLEVALSAVTPRQILDRVLLNLKVVYLQRGEPALARRTVELRIALAPWRLEETRDRGLLSATLGEYEAAERDLAVYLEGIPDAPDAERVRRQLSELRGRPS